MKTRLKTFAAEALGSFALAFCTIAPQSLFAANYSWLGRGSDTLFSTGANWDRGAAPASGSGDNMYFSVAEKTVTFDSQMKAGNWLFVHSEASGGQYDPATGEIHPVYWEATKPENGLSHSSGATVIGWGNAKRNGALVIRSGTYTLGWGGKLPQIGQAGGAGYLGVEGGTVAFTTLQLGQASSVGTLVVNGGNVTAAEMRVGDGGTGNLLVESGKLTMNGSLIAANAAGSTGEIVVGSGDPNRQAVVHVLNKNQDNALWLTKVAGGTSRLTVRKGGTVNVTFIGVDAGVAGADATLVLDGGTLYKANDLKRKEDESYVVDDNAAGCLFGYYAADHGYDKDLQFLVTENGGAFKQSVATRITVPLKLAPGATFGRVRNFGPSRLTIDEIGAGVGIAFGAESEVSNIEVGGTVLPTLEIVDGVYQASSHASLIQKMPAHEGKVLVSGGRFYLSVDVPKLVDGVPVVTTFNVNDMRTNYELAEGVRFEDIIVPEPVEGFEFTVFIDSMGVVSYVPHAVSGLPEAYTPLAFIRSTGDQHILAGCDLGPDEGVELNFGDVTYVESSTLFGQDTYGARSYLFCMQKNIFRFYGRSLVLPEVEANADYRFEVTATATTLTKIGGTATTIKTTNPVETADRELSVFGLHNGSYRSKYSLYGLKVRTAFGMLLHNFVPCLNECGEPGLFDTVERRFFGKTGTKRFIVPGEASDFVPIDDTDLLSEPDGTALVVKEGTLADVPAGVTQLRKTTPFPVNVSTVKALPAVTVEAGALTVKDGEVNTYVINGALKLMGGARLAVDLTKDGCDVFDATSVDLSAASSENPVYIVVNSADATTFQRHKTVIAGGISPSDLWKFKLVGNAYAKLRVYGSSLVLIDRMRPDGTRIIVR